MASGAIFKLLLRDDRFDNMFTAAGYLRRRLAGVRERRDGGAPTFAEVAQSHILFVQGAYRPYVDTASEYTRVKPAGDGASALGASARSVEFAFPTFGHFTSDMLLHVRFPAIGTAAPGAVPTPATPLLRYCALPGIRLLNRVELRAPVLLDEYTPDDVLAYAKFFVGADERPGWLRCLGQQEVREATYSANGYTGVLTYADGPQTPKLYHEGFDLLIPLQFWFCRGADRALPNDLLPNTRRTVTCQLAPLADIVSAYLPVAPPPGGAEPAPALAPAALPFSALNIAVDLYVNNLYVSPEVHDLFASRVGFALARLHRRQRFPVDNPADAYLLDALKFPTEYLALTVRARARRRPRPLVAVGRAARAPTPRACWCRRWSGTPASAAASASSSAARRSKSRRSTTSSIVSA